MNTIAHFSQSEVGRVKVGAKNIKENFRYMRIKRPRRKEERQKSKIAPAAWQEFIEI